ncbi:MAG: DNA-methyltransferase [Methylocella sp.]
MTSPPYWGLRDYGVAGQLGIENTPEEYVARMVEVFHEVRRVLKDDGTLWLNLGDSYAAGGNGGHGAKQHSNRGTRALAGHPKEAPPGLKPKDLVGITWRIAFALQADGWFLRQDIIWHKPNPMSESVSDRCTKAHEYIFLFSKSSTYYYDHEAIKEPSKYPDDDRKSRSNTYDKRMPTDMIAGVRHGSQTYLFRNKRSVWTVTTKPYKDAHFATFPPDLIEPCILAGAPIGGIVLDPFMGSGTTGYVARKHDRDFIGIELNHEYMKLVQARIATARPFNTRFTQKNKK